MANDKLTAEQIRSELEKQRGCLKNMLKSPNGRIGLQYLIAKFGGDVMVKGDDSASFCRVGERRVVDYLIELQGEE